MTPAVGFCSVGVVSTTFGRWVLQACRSASGTIPSLSIATPMTRSRSIARRRQEPRISQILREDSITRLAVRRKNGDESLLGTAADEHSDRLLP
jgi:hypothetical protein